MKGVRMLASHSYALYLLSSQREAERQERALLAAREAVLLPGTRQERERQYAALLQQLKAFPVQAEASLFHLFEQRSRLKQIFADEVLWAATKAIMENLLKFQEAVTQQSGELGAAGQNTRLAALRLAQKVLVGSRVGVQTGFWDEARLIPYGHKEILAVAKTLETATEVLKQPAEIQSYALLAQDIGNMRREIEGHPLFRREQRLLSGFLGTLGVLAGVALLTGTVLFSAVTMGLSGLALIPGMALLVSGMNLVANAVDPDGGKTRETVEREVCSKAAAGEFENLVGLSRRR
jgi:hypothetical protein